MINFRGGFSMLSSQKLMAFVATRDPARAKEFYANVLGLRFLSDDGFALVFDANGTTIRIATVRELSPVPYTVLGWEVDDIENAVKELVAAGVTFERYGIFPQDELGIWSAPGGARVAWFKDPDGNTLSLSQHG
jgi:catechol 2,3-dioxygenase-like lactoylglutathione lyase family enzyme